MAAVVGQVVGGKAQPQVDVSSVADVRKAMALGANYAASVNGEPADDEQELADGDFVTFAPQVKGA
jgi:hypothetical protein